VFWNIARISIGGRRRRRFAKKAAADASDPAPKRLQLEGHDRDSAWDTEENPGFHQDRRMALVDRLEARQVQARELAERIMDAAVRELTG